MLSLADEENQINEAPLPIFIFSHLSCFLLFMACCSLIEVIARGATTEEDLIV